jgi:methylmalonyl-CoA/ethylmalonyl-CoA epimerase
VFGQIDHIGVAVEDLDGAMTLYRERFGMAERHRETVEDQGVEAVLLEVGDGQVELLRPLAPDTAVGRFIANRGPGLHHVAYRTDDIDSALATVRDAGLELIDERPRAGIRHSRVAFLHPGSTGGVLTEIVEPAGEA